MTGMPIPIPMLFSVVVTIPPMLFKLVVTIPSLFLYKSSHNADTHPHIQDTINNVMEQRREALEADFIKD